jgi:hypothetical protein
VTLFSLLLLSACNPSTCMEGFLMTKQGTCVQAGGNNGEDADTDSDADADADSDADSDADADADSDADIDTGIGTIDTPPVIDCPAEWDGADITVSSMSVSEGNSSNSDTLDLGVGYTGGCTDHFVDVCWNREFSSDSPPEVELIIMHNNQGDTCNDPVTDDLSYLLVTLLDVWWSETGTGTGTVLLKLENREATWSF